jgi:glutathione S-transferase
MPILHHAPFCPHSRFVRLVLAEFSLEFEMVEEKPWERRAEFLKLNPAGETPVLVLDDGASLVGARVIAEYCDDVLKTDNADRRLMPQQILARAEVRRLMDWSFGKLHDEVTRYLVTEKINKRFMSLELGGGAPDMASIRAARTNIRYHLQYIGFLAGHRKWLAGDDLSYADLAMAAHLSCADYLGDIPWDEDETARNWYARVKSRPSFRSILADRVPGMAPAEEYANLDF